MRVLIVRLSAMGDIIHALPAVAALRQARPDAKIGWLIEERWGELLCSRSHERLAPRSQYKPLADWVHLANFSAWRTALFSGDSWRAMRDCLREVRSMRYDVVLDLQGAIRSALAAVASGARARVGSSLPREAPARMLYTRASEPAGAHVIEQGLSLASPVAARTLAFTAPTFPCDPENEQWADGVHSDIDGAPFAILNPGAGWGAKCWPAESFGAVAKALDVRGVRVLVNYGPGEEALAEAVCRASDEAARGVTCSVGQLIALTRRARLFVGGDTGPMHLAAALAIPVIALFGPTTPERNGPYATRSVVLRNAASVESLSHVATPDEGLLAIQPQAVIEAADQLLGGRECRK